MPILGKNSIPVALLSLAAALVGFGALLLVQYPPDYERVTPDVEVLGEAETSEATAAPTTSPTTAASATSATPTTDADASVTTAPGTTTAEATTTEALAETVDSTEVSIGPSTYRIESGDTLSALATRFGTSVQALVDLNAIANPDLIFAGQVLRLNDGTSEQTVAFGIEGFDTTPFASTAAAVDLEPELLQAVAWVASGWDAAAAIDGVGIGQLDPAVHDFVERELVGRELDTADTDDGVEAMGNYLAWLFAQAGGETSSALAAYYEDLLTARNIGWSQETLDFVDQVRTARRQFVLSAQAG
ncbi:MAG: LysM peptidoglycan-binding domain-containing protein [Acidimicrobiales bacterium]